MRDWMLSHRRPAMAQEEWKQSKGPTKHQPSRPHWIVAHARLKSEFTEDEKYHNLIKWLKYFCGSIYSGYVHNKIAFLPEKEEEEKEKKKKKKLQDFFFFFFFLWFHLITETSPSVISIKNILYNCFTC